MTRRKPGAAGAGTPAAIRAALGPLRREIDRIDDSILELLHRRLEVVREVGHLKRSATRGAWVPTREKRILERLLDENRGRFPEDALTAIYRTLFSASRREELPETVAFYGKPGSIAHAAAREQFGGSTRFVPAESLVEVFDAVSSGQADYGVVPPEISREGLVSHSFDMFLRSDLKICAEYFMRLHLVLASPGRRRIRRVHLQPLILEFVRHWLGSHFQGGVQIHLAATSREAAEDARDDPGGAAICHPFAADLHGLVRRVDPIPYGAPHHIRFLTAGRTLAEATDADKTTIGFALVDRQGALERALGCFSRHRINLTFLESYTVSRASPTVTFFADVEGHHRDRRLEQAVTELTSLCSFVRVMGSYPQFKI